VRIFEGRVVQTNPKFIAGRANVEVHTHPALKEALEDADSEFKQSITSGRWEPYGPA
jgi:hypothetical protein